MAGQSAFQLAAMYALVFHGDALFGVPPAASVQGPSVHYTLVFNAFVMMQLFNQARPPGRALAGMSDRKRRHSTRSCMHASRCCLHTHMCARTLCEWVLLPRILIQQGVVGAPDMACVLWDVHCAGTARHAGSHTECAGTCIQSQQT